MREAFYFYGQVHKQYLWLHVVSFFALAVTSVFWFILPLYIVNYGNYEATWLLNISSALFLCTIPSSIITIHCWVISFSAAKKWCERKRHEHFWMWLFRFQAMAFFIATAFLSVILGLFFIIDLIR